MVNFQPGAKARSPSCEWAGGVALGEEGGLGVMREEWIAIDGCALHTAWGEALVWGEVSR